MRFESENMYSYPVLEQGSELPAYKDASINLTMSPKYRRDENGEEYIECNFSYVLNEPTLEAMVGNGQARIGVLVDCRSAMDQIKLFLDDSDNHRIPAGAVVGKTIFRLFVLATDDIPFFTSPNFVDFFKGSYEVKAGEPLAFTLPKTFYMERDAFKPLDSVMNLRANDEATERMFDVDTHNDKIDIILDAKSYHQIQIARRHNDPETKMNLINGLYMPALMAAIFELKTTKDINYKWARVLRNAIEIHNLSLEDDPAHIIAQRIFKFPLDRFCFYIEQFKGNE